MSDLTREQRDQMRIDAETYLRVNTEPTLERAFIAQLLATMTALEAEQTTRWEAEADRDWCADYHVRTFARPGKAVYGFIRRSDMLEAARRARGEETG